ncbi:MAG: serine hydrolase [Firmicutes bacterium]|nr:serine hydrolase [Bacillota bacterium]
MGREARCGGHVDESFAPLVAFVARMAVPGAAVGVEVLVGDRTAVSWRQGEVAQGRTVWDTWGRRPSDGRDMWVRTPARLPRLGQAGGDRQEKDGEGRELWAGSRFNVYSVRKAYIGLAVAWALSAGAFSGVDERISDWLCASCSASDKAGSTSRGAFAAVVGETTLRHLLTHTHGLCLRGGRLARRFQPGTGWQYNNVGVLLLGRVLRAATGMTAADIVRERVLHPLGFFETDWEVTRDRDLLADVPALGGPRALVGTRDGEQRNLYASARELAAFGALHLTGGRWRGRRADMGESVFAQAMALLTPESAPARVPRHAYLWWRKGGPQVRTEIGAGVPDDAVQILGKSGCLCLVVPSRKLVAVRMSNDLRSHLNPLGFLRAARAFGDLACACAREATDN